MYLVVTIMVKEFRNGKLQYVKHNKLYMDLTPVTVLCHFFLFSYPVCFVVHTYGYQVLQFDPSNEYVYSKFFMFNEPYNVSISGKRLLVGKQK